MSKNKNQKPVTSERIERATFTYAQGNTKLEFTLRVDIKKELEDFKQCLEAALQDINNQLEK